MIKSFKHKGLKKLFYDNDPSKIQVVHLKKILDILDLLNGAHDVRDMNFPGSHLHPLKGSLNDFWSVRVSGNWRVIFRFINSDAFDVDYVDYH